MDVATIFAGVVLLLAIALLFSVIKIVPYNLFYGDIERDVSVRLAAWRAKRGL